MTRESNSSLNQLVSAVTANWPEHAAFLRRSMEGRAECVISVSERIAEAIFAIADATDGLDKLCSDYRFMCEKILLPEELHFRRHGTYRLSRFEDANAECYSNDGLMRRYMSGLLLSNALWSNHAHAFAYFVNKYLPELPRGSRHLEIGPGHGLFLYFAAASPSVASITGWDVSPTSIGKTEHALKLLGSRLAATLELQDLFAAPTPQSDGLFDSIALSEILEHLEDPVAALVATKAHLKPGGRIFVNVPANSPAPDHIFLYTSPEHAREVCEQAGFTVLDTAAFPMSGATLEQARKHKLSISCVVTALYA